MVLSAADGAVLFRRELPAYSRSAVAFLGRGHVAYTRVEGGTSRTVVLRLPAPPA